MTSAPGRQTPSVDMERPARAAFVGALIAALITLPGLGVGTLWDNSETAYGEVAREILLDPRLDRHASQRAAVVRAAAALFLDRRALCQSSSASRRFALRLPAAIATILMGAMTGYAVARQAGTRVGIYASAILSSCLMQAVIGRLAIMDALLDLAVALTCSFGFRALEAGTRPLLRLRLDRCRLSDFSPKVSSRRSSR